MKIAVTGASGLIGSALVPALAADGHSVVTLVRRPPHPPSEIHWDPAADRLAPDALAGVDAVVHLAGAGIGDRRWTAAYKRVLVDSRTRSTALLARTIAATDPPPRVLLSGSAIGWYGTAAGGDAGPVDESAPPGTGFLAELVRDWEAAAAPAREAGVRICHLRTGVVLSAAGGTLARQLPLFRLGLGGRLGSGRQWLSWIGRTDHVAATSFLLTETDLAGPVNLVSPGPVTNAEFTQALAAAVNRPAPAPVPRVALRLALGEFTDEGILASQRLAPTALTRAGFSFTHPDLGTALPAALADQG